MRLYYLNTLIKVFLMGVYNIFDYGNSSNKMKIVTCKCYKMFFSNN